MLFRGISRRAFLKAASAATVAAAAGVSLEACGDGEEEPSFFTPEERATLEMAAALILPGTPNDPGAREANVVCYIENLLAAFDRDPPLIFAGGPFSGRHPFPDNESGSASGRFPRNAFGKFLLLSRVKEIAWRARIFGSANVPGADFNDAALGPTKGWRGAYREGLAALDAKSRELHEAEFIGLTSEQQNEVLTAVDQEFVSLLAEHVVEGMYAPPEYGGNNDLAGWKSIFYEGDSQPLGYSVFHQPTGSYAVIAEHPVAGPNPDEDFSGLDAEALEFAEGIAKVAGGERFY